MKPAWKAVLFDLDGVLTTDKTGSTSTLRSLMAHTGLPEEPLRTAYYRHNREMLHGQLTHADVWPEICAEVGQELPYSLLHTAFIETPMDADMLRLLRDVKAAGGQVALVTDNKADRIAAILAHHRMEGMFDLVSISAQVGATKRERLPFERVLAQLGVTAGECVFIDNTAANLVVPQERGIHTVLFDDQERDVAGLRKLLLADE